MNQHEPGRNVYIGHRYVPLIIGEWDKSIAYEGLSIVTYKGGSYTSKKRVPVGIDIENDEFWVITGNYNAQVEYYRDETERVSQELTKKSDITYVDDELDKKSDITYVDDELDKKSDKTYVDDELDKKSDITYVDDELDKQSDITNEKLNEKADKSYLTVNVMDYGAVGDGVADDSQAFIDAINEGKKVYVPSPPVNYVLKRTIPQSKVHLQGDGHETTKIITSASKVFDNLSGGTLFDIRFQSDTPLTNTLAGRDSGTFNGIVERCYFQDYEYHFNYPGNFNGARIEKNHFRHGKYGIVGNQAHASSIIKNTFWQQQNFSMVITRATGGEIEGNSFVGTQGRASTVKLFSVTQTFMNNYFEFYPSTGENIPQAIIVEWNNATGFPIFINNLINGKDIVNKGIDFVNVGTVNSNNNHLIMIKNSISRVREQSNIDSKIFDNLSFIGNNFETPPSKINYISELSNVSTDGVVNMVLPIDDGDVIDPMGISNDDNTLTPTKSGKKYKWSIQAEMDVQPETVTGIEIIMVDENGSKTKRFNYIENTPGYKQSPKFTMIDTSQSNSKYRISVNKIHELGVNQPIEMNFICQLEEIDI